MTTSAGPAPPAGGERLANELRAVVLAAQVGGDEPAQAGADAALEQLDGEARC